MWKKAQENIILSAELETFSKIVGIVAQKYTHKSAMIPLTHFVS